ncbi:nickel/cobalt transporter [Curvivirga aplysinae]|uniref:nickel/cobalt transporter n=1 Tax=Curvivirga aplysinae TaxID=2529852 RepID=UPI0012BC2037|nr:nickel/cobalt transporter [Curvivirga aplysinae]MTI08413.1 nickel/cobalt transporter [Curvivirga aplysinae]
MFLKRAKAALTIGSGVSLIPNMAHASIWGDITGYIREQQQALHMELANALQAVQDGGQQALISLLVLSFLYGAFHAAGPGHGKAVIGTYILSHKSHVKRSMFLSAASAIVQGITAIVLVKAVSSLIFFSQWAIKDTVPVMEQTSFLFVALIGLFLMFRAIRQFIRMRNTSEVHNGSVSHTHSHAHSHGHSHGTSETCSSCGHNHAIGPEQVAQISGWRDTMGIVISIGIRPCTGSVIVLTFAELFGLGWAGVLSVMLISLGTALTVSLLALMTVYFRDLAVYLMQGKESRLMSYGPIFASFVGGLVILLLGSSLMIDASMNSHPLF